MKTIALESTRPLCPFQLETLEQYEAKPNGWKHTPERVRHPVTMRGRTFQAETLFTVKFRVKIGEQYIRSTMRANLIEFTDPYAQPGSTLRHRKQFEYPHDAFCWASQISGAIVEPFIQEFCYA